MSPVKPDTEIDLLKKFDSLTASETPHRRSVVNSLSCPPVFKRRTRILCKSKLNFFQPPILRPAVLAASEEASSEALSKVRTSCLTSNLQTVNPARATESNFGNSSDFVNFSDLLESLPLSDKDSATGPNFCTPRRLFDMEEMSHKLKKTKPFKRRKRTISAPAIRESELKESQSDRESSPSTCAQQALKYVAEDTSIEELAAYFDTFVHIPKKMSQMAEMMYT